MEYYEYRQNRKRDEANGKRHKSNNTRSSDYLLGVSLNVIRNKCAVTIDAKKTTKEDLEFGQQFL